MPRLTAGGPEAAANADESIVRVDISPDDIKSMSTEELTELLTRLRANRIASPPLKAKAYPSGQRKARESTPSEPDGIASIDDLDEM
jgi:hypothetical protein